MDRIDCPPDPVRGGGGDGGVDLAADDPGTTLGDLGFDSLVLIAATTKAELEFRRDHPGEDRPATVADFRDMVNESFLDAGSR